MSGAGGAYRVLARKYRPRSFDDLVGQEPMVRTLKNAFETGRIAQAYMLTGVRGVGKTTTARILARGLNYLIPGKIDRPTIDMPELGVHCAEIMEGRHVDVIEMDAASNNGIDNIREIIESVRYKPVSARYKVYILDEVHMLSGAAFNGLLKTLEEPPEHVKFIFATTEIRKVPVTVLSRCQRFDLRRIESDRLIGLLSSITAKEDVSIEADALAMIARAAEGSARDSLSLLDQAIAHGAGTISAEDVRGMLGLADRARIVDLFEALMAGRTAEALDLLKQQYDIGADPAVVLQDLAAFTHTVTRFKVVPSSSEDSALPQEERQRGRALSEAMSLRVLSRAWQMLLKGIEEVSTSSRPLAAADMVLIRIAHAADLPTPDEALRLLKSGAASAGLPSPGPSSSVPALSLPMGQPSGGAPAPAISQMRVQQSPVAAPVASVPNVETARQPEPARKAEPAIRFQRFEDLVAYVGLKRDIPLKIALETQVRLIRFDNGFLEFEPTDDAPRALSAEIARKISDWTGERWVVAVGRGEGQPTIAEARAAEKDKARSDARADPLVAAVLARFPGAEIVDVQIRADDTADLPIPALPAVENPDEAPEPGED
ncbi:DNA polymerase III subunit gamma/tau [Kaistia dalseonensis]|uniref:DNA polymerase III subunit gamma/tau n=1 Tax=Kaistia dalseonensis TaxID=410840 RepID=A0ABU0H9F6_9HYPH|nr:DNA polymerase III subunit gamma/tau [Kaistia dalseonensis]MCX5496335.1 DNA polymerase III subunit gamma/tau [Kaistia dalseonensis]MDQ0438954.1 DNA polymerase-3 subunit gamma/tau [Kaistia dalseonensis]